MTRSPRTRQKNQGRKSIGTNPAVPAQPEGRYDAMVNLARAHDAGVSTGGSVLAPSNQERQAKPDADGDDSRAARAAAAGRGTNHLTRITSLSLSCRCVYQAPIREHSGFGCRCVGMQWGHEPVTVTCKGKASETASRGAGSRRHDDAKDGGQKPQAVTRSAVSLSCQSRLRLAQWSAVSLSKVVQKHVCSGRGHCQWAV